MKHESYNLLVTLHILPNIYSDTCLDSFYLIEATTFYKPNETTKLTKINPITLGLYHQSIHHQIFSSKNVGCNHEKVFDHFFVQT